MVDVSVSDSYDSFQDEGTGMVVSSDGEVVTDYATIEGATEVSVTDVGNGTTYQATVAGYDRADDVAVLQLEHASGLQTAKLGDSSKVATGEGVVAVGNAEGAGGTPSEAGGSVAATDQSVLAADQVSGTSEQLAGLIGTNAEVLPGQAGGALVDSSGRVIGMITASSVGFQLQPSAAQGYALPIDQAVTVAKQIAAKQSSSTVHVGPTAFLGVKVEAPSAGTPGLLITEVIPQSPAAKAALAPGDRITAVGDQAMTSADSLINLLIGEAPGASVPVHYLNASGMPGTVTVRLATGPPE